MGKKSSKQKGDELENRVYTLLEKQIENGDFIANGKFCKLYKQKAYYSRDRQSDIIVDVSIEVTYPNEKDYALLFVFECKNYKGAVSIILKSFLVNYRR